MVKWFGVSIPNWDSFTRSFTGFDAFFKGLYSGLISELAKPAKIRLKKTRGEIKTLTFTQEILLNFFPNLEVKC